MSGSDSLTAMRTSSLAEHQSMPRARRGYLAPLANVACCGTGEGASDIE